MVLAVHVVLPASWFAADVPALAALLSSLACLASDARLVVEVPAEANRFACMVTRLDFREASLQACGHTTALARLVATSSGLTLALAVSIAAAAVLRVVGTLLSQLTRFAFPLPLALLLTASAVAAVATVVLQLLDLVLQLLDAFRFLLGGGLTLILLLRLRRR